MKKKEILALKIISTLIAVVALIASAVFVVIPELNEMQIEAVTDDLQSNYQINH